MQPDRLQYLLDRFIHHQATREETEELALWIDTIKDHSEWRSRLETIWTDFKETETLDASASEMLLKRILQQKRLEERPVSPLVRGAGKWWAIAAAVAVFLSVGTYIFYQADRNARKTLIAGSTPARPEDIPPGGNKAILTLGSGKKLILDSAQKGTLASRQGVQIIKLDSGMLAYQPSSAHHRDNAPPEYNTLTTPRGGQYQIVLPDGSHVWLNAASSLRFPTAFQGAERRVTLRGEGYFEVNKPNTAGKKALQPFIVAVVTPSGKTAEVQVLGTHFNVNAYEDEPVIKTTLLEGAVKVKDPGQDQVYTLSPGQQAIIAAQSVQINRHVNTDEITAWKDGLFDFEGINIRAVMKQVSRWYDVEVKYQTHTSAHFVGTISRNVHISGVLHLLEMTGAVRFQVTGNTITVL